MSDTEAKATIPLDKIKGVRLNNTMRSRAVTAVVAFAIDNRVRELLVRQSALADRAYNDVLTPKHRKLLAEIPGDWDAFKSLNAITVNVGGWTVTLPFFDPSVLTDDMKVDFNNLSSPIGSPYRKGTQGTVTITDLIRKKHNKDNFARPWPFRDVGYGASASSYQVVSDPDLMREIQELASDIKSTREDIQSLQAEVTGLIGSFTTVTKLLETWPEIAELVPDLCPEVESKNLAPVIDNVRARILNMRGESNDKTSKEAMEKRKPVPTINITT